LGVLKKIEERRYFLSVQHVETNLVASLTGILKITRNANISN
jgi:hypothetical protein